MGMKKYTATVRFSRLPCRHLPNGLTVESEVIVMAESIADAISRAARKAQGFRPSSNWRWNADVKIDGESVRLERGALYRRVGPDSWAKFGPAMTIEILKPEGAS